MVNWQHLMTDKRKQCEKSYLRKASAQCLRNKEMTAGANLACLFVAVLGMSMTAKAANASKMLVVNDSTVSPDLGDY